jgi:hypothetical protein
VKGKSPSSDDVQQGQVMDAIRLLSDEVKALRQELAARG